VKELEKNIDYNFTDKDLLKKALIHRSFVKDTNLSNEKLELLGDAVIGLATVEYLFKNYPSFTEGNLSKIKAASVCTEALSKIAHNLELYKYLKVGKGEIKENIALNPSVLENTFEALIGAIYLDGGWRRAKKVALKFLRKKITEAIEKDISADYKTVLQEITQKKFSTLPCYKLEREEGEEHKKTFYIGVYINEKLYGRGRGETKKEAEKIAAKKAIRRLKNV
jgi:ribonuclease-3